MSKNFGDTRYQKRDKRRKANLVLNILIGIVTVLILVIGSQLLLGGDDQRQASTESNEKKNSEQIANENTNKNRASDDQEVDDETSNDTNESSAEENLKDKAEEEEKAAKEKEENKEEINPDDPFANANVKEGGADGNVKQTIENPNWDPIGTEQSGEHSATYDKSSQDWAEMTQAMSYATGISEDDMIIWFLGNGGSPQDAKGTISTKDKSEKYRVSLHWVEGEGWKPTKVEVLNSIQ
ncbi:DUF1510 family protein [Metabacillus arenae]|uniref:DUF1510 family protein n=1 Tax=Metabacillus arenae TaxID=2771434 RepID=A0A926NQG2_9BACI|nr:DUF1510 family protein [Metabacillus arenae]MBD1382056.1 DUF1510 family protein [Metabacillus arenae]